MKRTRRKQTCLAVLAATAVLTSLTQISSVAAPTNQAASERTGPVADPAVVPPGERAQLLGKEWSRSGDRAWTTSGDADGFHILTADQKDGYAWKTAATLSEPGFDADAWIGNTCVTGSGKRAVVVYAPRTFTNKPQLMARGGFTAIVDLDTGQVNKLDLLASLSYYNPGCGTGESVVLTQSGGEDRPGTRLIQLDTTAGKLTAPIETKGQVTSAIPAADGRIVAASGAELIQVDGQGRRTALARTVGVPYRLTPDGDGGVVFLDKKGTTSTVKRITAAAVTHPDARRTQPTLLAEGLAAETGLVRSASTVYIAGNTRLAPKTALPTAVAQLVGARKDVLVTTKGDGFLQPPEWADGKGTLLPPGDADRARPVKLALTMATTGRQAAFTVDPTHRTTSHPAQGRAASPALTSHTHRPATAKAKGAAAASSPTDPVEAERTCSVPRNDPRNQAMQPKPRQVEWAVDQAVTGNLNTLVKRPANWKNLGMPEYAPQSLFLNPVVEGGDRAIAQVMLGVATQESNMWQAGREAVPGVTANPLIGNYYGINLYDGDSGNDWDVNFANADCGYGITQITDHMRMAGREDGHGGTAWDYQKQRAAALDYTANISAGLQTLISKWNETRAAGLIANHGTSARPENWYFALWAYNSGFHPKTSDGSPWGLGWANNPANPEWDAGRLPFMENANGDDDASAAARPQNWPYQEKVLGFAAHPPAFLESPGKMVPAFRAASWNGTNDGVTTKGSAKYNRAHVKAPEDLFCDTSNTCNPSRISDSATNDSATSGPCGRADFKCWWSKPATWKTDCVTTCGYEFMRFNNTYPEEADGTAYPPNCTTSGLPSNALIVDDVPTGTPVPRPGCTNTWTNSGSFAFAFGNNGTESVYPSKVDLHQLGAGFGGHFYYGHTRQNDAKGQRLKITGTWKLKNRLPKAMARVWVHLPDHGAQTAYAQYEIKTVNGIKKKTINQKGAANRWVSLGSYRFNAAIPEMALTTITSNGTGDDDIAFDAVAFEPGDPQDLGIMPLVSIPDGEPQADLPGFDDQPIRANRNTGTSAARGAVPGLGDRCSPRDAKGRTLCMRLSSDKKSAPQKRVGSKSPSAAGDIVSWCAPMSPGNDYYTRTEACLRKISNVSLFWMENGKELGWADFVMEMQIKLHPNLNEFDQYINIVPTRVDPTLGQVTVSWDTTNTCGADCPQSPKVWTGEPSWNTKDLHTAKGLYQTKWGGTGEEKFDLGWMLTGRASVTPLIANHDLGGTLGDLTVRCDNITKGTVSPGCVFSTYIPTYPIPTKRYPAAGAYYWLMREKLASHPGSKERKKPLHYLADGQRGNRDVICPTNWDAHPSTPSGSCDEYAFATTYESGGLTGGANKVDSGDECVQLHAAPPDQSQNQWTIRLDDRDTADAPEVDADDPAIWKAKCGRASIPLDQNTGAMAPFGRNGGFVPSKRLLDNEPFWLGLSGFEHCVYNADSCTFRPSDAR